MAPLATAVVPVKALPRAKTRLALPDARRRGLALAFAVDTVAALTGCDRIHDVLVVTPDPDVARRLGALGARVVPDDTRDLNAAVRVGAASATARHPDGAVLVVPADLPCLRPGDVDDVLEAAATQPVAAFVPDRSSTGTTLVVHPPGRPPEVRYGAGSAARHRDLGLRELGGAPLRARHDVDTLGDLRTATWLGVGPATAGWLSRSGRPGAPGVSPRWRPSRSG